MKIATSFSKQVVPPRKKCKSSVVWEQRKRELVCALSLSRSSFLSLSLSVFIQGKRKEHQQVSPYVYEGNQDTFNPSSVFSTFFFSAFLRFFFLPLFIIGVFWAWLQKRTKPHILKLSMFCPVIRLLSRLQWLALQHWVKL